MEREKLLQNPLPIDRVAARVVKKAKPEDQWRPMPKTVDYHHVVPGSVLRCAPLPKTAPQSLLALVGARRGRVVVLGYAAEQLDKHSSARWVVRCDCGNHEYRSRILRWIGTKADDMCRECRTRIYKLRGEWAPREKAERATLAANDAP